MTLVAACSGYTGLSDCVDRFGVERVRTDDAGSVELTPYGARWPVTG